MAKEHATDGALRHVKKIKFTSIKPTANAAGKILDFSSFSNFQK